MGKFRTDGFKPIGKAEASAIKDVEREVSVTARIWGERPSINEDAVRFRDLLSRISYLARVVDAFYLYKPTVRLMLAFVETHRLWYTEYQLRRGIYENCEMLEHWCETDAEVLRDTSVRGKTLKRCLYEAIGTGLEYAHYTYVNTQEEI